MNLPLAITAVVFAASTVLASPPASWSTDVSKALSQAKKENKMGFILMGREACSNCQATKKLVNESKIPVTAETFVVADINVDDQRSNAEFNREFKKEKFGNMLPFVVITDSKGKPLASYSGYKSPEELTKLVNEASTKAQASATGKK